MEEVWKDIEGYDGDYQISNFGNVKSFKSKMKGKNRKNKKTPKGYYAINLSKNSKSNNFLVHRLVAKHFINNPNNKPQVNHIDGNKTNNKVTNLEWCTNLENQKHAFNVLKIKVNRLIGEENKSSKLKEKDIKEIRKLKPNTTYLSLSKKYNVTPRTIRMIILGKTWKHIK